ncbi:MAG: hypothetical protein K5857_09185 [Lachnospiraceae bacterium]|nr:hypothetical protein [Lachnospiraceae bacterium]
MIKERILCVSVGWTCVGLIIAGLVYAVYMYKKGKSGRLVLIWLCQLSVLAAVAYLAFSMPEFYKEKQKRMWNEVRKNGYILTINGKRPDRREERKITSRRKNRLRYILNDINDVDKVVDVRPKENAPIKEVRGFELP